MKRNFGWTLAVGTLVVAACGSDGSGGGSGDGDKTPKADSGSPATPTNRDAGTDTSASPVSSGGGSCGKGELKVGTGELDYCDPSDSDDSCPSTEKLVGYTSVNGDLNIYPGKSKDLSAASCLQSAGTLSISGGTEISSLKGLDSLKSAKALEVLGLDNLTSLSGIDKLGSVNELTINGNPLLTDLKGLPSGFKVGSLYVNGNPELTSLDGLDNITVTEVIAFENNIKLSSCKAAAFAKKFPSAEFSNFGNLTEECN
jgi:hypothetical protein